MTDRFTLGKHAPEPSINGVVEGQRLTSITKFMAAPVTNTTAFTFQLVVNDGASNSAPSQTTDTLLPALRDQPPIEARVLVPTRADGHVQFRLIGVPERTYRLEGSINQPDKLGYDSHKFHRFLRTTGFHRE